MPVVIPARITVVTIGARDLETLRDFYEALGWRAAVRMDDFAAFETSGAVLTLYPLDDLAGDAKASPTPPTEDLRGVALAINVDSREEVDSTIDSVRDAGGRVTKEPVDAEWGGRSAYFADLEGNYWEVAWVPPDSKMAALIKAATRT